MVVLRRGTIVELAPPPSPTFSAPIPPLCPLSLPRLCSPSSLTLALVFLPQPLPPSPSSLPLLPLGDLVATPGGARRAFERGLPIGVPVISLPPNESNHL